MMIDVLRSLCAAVIGLFRSSTRREAEIMVLRHQLNVLRRGSPKRIALSNVDRLLFVWLSRLVPTTLDALMVVGPETVIRWQRAGFRAYWRSRERYWNAARCGRIQIVSLARFAIRCRGAQHSTTTNPILNLIQGRRPPKRPGEHFRPVHPH